MPKKGPSKKVFNPATIRIEKEIRDRLNSFMFFSITYNDVIQAFLDTAARDEWIDQAVRSRLDEIFDERRNQRGRPKEISDGP